MQVLNFVEAEKVSGGGFEVCTGQYLDGIGWRKIFMHIQKSSKNNELLCKTLACDKNYAKWRYKNTDMNISNSGACVVENNKVCLTKSVELDLDVVP